MSDREKKIAEIREWHEGKKDSFPQFTVFEAVGVMLDEIDRIEREYAEERAAHNAHVAELCELEQELDMYKASSEVFYERLKKTCEDREKLIDALQTISTDTECPYTSAFAKRKLKEIGVVVK